MQTENPFQAPQTIDLPPPRHAPAQEGLGSLLFSFDGRIPRRVYWAVTILSTIAFCAAIIVVALLLRSAETASGLTMMVLYPLYIWIGLAIQAKRWHDHDKSGWWFLINFIPIIGPIWSFVELGCLRGTYGPNSYGADPT